MRKDRFDAGKILAGQGDLGGCRILGEAGGAARSGDRHDVLTLRQQPGERQLRHLDSPVLRQLAQRADRFAILFIVAGLPAFIPAAHVVGGVFGGWFDGRGQKAAAERGVGDEADPELADRGQDLGLDGALENRVLALQHGDRMDSVRAADRVRAGLAETEKAHLALLDELSHRPCNVLDRDVGIDAVLVEHVEVVGAQEAQAVLGHLAYVFGPAVVVPRAVGLERQHEPELSRGVEERHAQRVRGTNRGDAAGLVGGAVGHRHPHRAEADRADLEALGSKRSALHAGTSVLAAASGNRTPVSCSETSHSRRATAVSFAASERSTSFGWPRISMKPPGPAKLLPGISATAA